jgi:hypothetical protein
MTVLTSTSTYLFTPREEDDRDAVAASAFALASVMTLVMLLLRTPAQSTVLLTALVIIGILARQYTTQTRWYWVVLFGILPAVAGSRQSPVAAMREGASDFIEKPWDNTRLLSVLRNQVELGRALHESRRLRAENDLLRAGHG